MPAWQVALLVPKESVEDAETVLRSLATEEEHPALSCFADAETGFWRVDGVFLAEPDRTRVTQSLIDNGLGSTGFSIFKLGPVDWVAEALKHHQPVEAGRYYVHGSHHPARPGRRYAINIDAGMAFGTGQHETTLGCLKALDWLAKSKQVFNPLDLGCGTGVLAIATAKTWSCVVTASDIDPDSTRITLENAIANGVGSRVETVAAAGLHHPALRAGAPYDLITANILAGPLRVLAEDIVSALAADGVLVLSGFLLHQEAAVFGAYRNRGLRQLRRFPVGDWVTLVLAR